MNASGTPQLRPQGDNLPCRITLVWSKLHISKTPVQRPLDLAGGDNRYRDMGRYLPHRDWICPYPVSKGREGPVRFTWRKPDAHSGRCLTPKNQRAYPCRTDDAHADGIVRIAGNSLVAQERTLWFATARKRLGVTSAQRLASVRGSCR